MESQSGSLGVVHLVEGAPGASGIEALSAEVDELRARLAFETEHVETERVLAAEIGRARHLAIVSSPVISDIYGVDEPENLATRPDISVSDHLSHSFGVEVEPQEVDERFARTLSIRLRKPAHPDAGGEHAEASAIGDSLRGLKGGDAPFALAKAVVETGQLEEEPTEQDLRDERYRLHLILDGLEPIFGTIDEAEAVAAREVDTAEWRVRVGASFKLFQELIGSPDQMNSFLRRIVSNQRVSAIRNINWLLPQIQSAQERIIKGDPKDLTPTEVEQIDELFGEIWESITRPREGVDKYLFTAPHISWFGHFLRALKILDPGQKPGERYTLFQAPIKIVEDPPARRPDIKPARRGRRGEQSLLGDKNLIIPTRREENIFDNDPYGKYSKTFFSNKSYDNYNS